MRTTLGHIRTGTRIPQYLKIGPNDTRLVQYLNEATQRLLHKGIWWGCYQRYRVCVTDGCITWPRHVAAILSVAVDDSPIPLMSDWFEFIEYGWGLREAADQEAALFPRGTAAAFNDVTGAVSKLKVYCDVPETAGAQILLRGYDENWNWIRTQVAGVWQDGEYVSLNSVTPQLSTHYFRGALATPIKPVTNGVVRVNQYDTVAHTERALAIYEPDEERPEYLRSLIPGLAGAGGSATCSQVAVTIMAKMEYYPVANNNDFLLIGNEVALKHACRACQLYDEGAEDKADKEMARALQELDDELGHHLGPNQFHPIVVADRTFGIGGIPGPISPFGFTTQL